MAVGTVVTRGFGPDASIAFVVTAGYGAGVAADTINTTDTPTLRHLAAVYYAGGPVQMVRRIWFKQERAKRKRCGCLVGDPLCQCEKAPETSPKALYLSVFEGLVLAKPIRPLRETILLPADVKPLPRDILIPRTMIVKTRPLRDVLVAESKRAEERRRIIAEQIRVNEERRLKRLKRLQAEDELLMLVL